ncbi:MAG: hypothetical protein JWM73_19 [Solirubrobacterales bacterium]|jgi:hypothetical protein|nr:hypothetical protein [Solirubrobacterales bacterium]
MEIGLVVIVVAMVAFCVLGYVFQNRGPGDNVRDPQVKNRRNNWVP